MGCPYDLAAEAADVVVTGMGTRPAVAIVAGSGWAEAVAELGSESAALPLDGVPGMVGPTVVGHRGTIRLIDADGVPTVAVAGRLHRYEGHSVDAVVHTVRTLVMAGCRTVILTNAAGSLDPERSVGEVVLISDQLNLTGDDPLAGPEPPSELPSRFCDLGDLYDADLRRVAIGLDSLLGEGVYAGVRGPSYETAAEVAMLRTVGADLVGMSTVLEAIAARHLGARVAGISLVTNQAAGSGGDLSHDRVLEAGRHARTRLAEVMRLMVAATELVPPEPDPTRRG